MSNIPIYINGSAKWFFIMVILLSLFFIGEPDLMDAIIKWIGTK